MYRRPISLRTILLITIGTLTLIITLLVGREVWLQWNRLTQIHSLKEAMIMSDRLFDATEKLSVERDIAYTMLHAPDEDTVKDLQPQLEQSWAEADDSFTIAMRTLGEYHFPEIDILRGKIETQLMALHEMRKQINIAMALPREQREIQLSDRWFAQSTDLITQIQDLWMEFVRHFTAIDPIVTQHLRYKHFLRVIADYDGRARAIIGRILVENTNPTPEEFNQLLHSQGIIELSWKISEILASHSGLMATIAPYYSDARSHYFTLHDMVKDIFYILPGSRPHISYPIGVSLWFELSAQATESFNALKKMSLQETRSYVDTLELSAQREIGWHMLLLAAALGICIYSFSVVTRRVIRPIHTIIDALMHTMQGKRVSLAPAMNDRMDEIGKLGQVLHAFQQNMEQIKRNATELQHYTQALERSNRELDDFAYIASHDLKEPLRGLFNHASFLIEDYEGTLDDDGVRRLRRLSYLAQRMEHLVNDLLYFSRLGRTELAVQETDPNAIVQETELLLESFMKERNARIVVPTPLPRIICDRPRVAEVFRNLITNAVKYNDKPERIIEVGFLEEVETPQGPEKKVFYVRDNGVGIEQEFHEEIFRIFKRLQRPAEEKESGTGAGLTFVKKIVERHGGHVWLTSEPGKGTTFYFTLIHGGNA